MSANFDTIAIIGATSGLGEGFTRRFHAQGKKVIATGRRLERLQSLKKELPGLDIQQMDIENIGTLPQQIGHLLASFPKLDTVMVAAGIQSSFNFKDPKSTSPSAISSEIAINVTAPMVIAHQLIPHLLSLQRSTTFILVSSGLAFVPVPMFPIYCGTKSAIHSFAINLRAQLLDTQCKVAELAPPYVDTPLDAAHRERLIEVQGGAEKAVKPMALEEYLDSAMKGFEDGRKEVAVGFSQIGVDKWRQTFGPVLEMRGNRG